MHLDFALILTALTLAAGLIWMVDALVFKPRRRRRLARGEVDSDAPGKVAETARSFFPVLLLVLVFRSFLFEPFKIPSGSMIPTLWIGDFILVNKYAYGLRLPVLNTRFLEVGDPERGDVMVFRFPEDESVNYIKRVVGLPGDRITYRNKILYINGAVRYSLSTINQNRDIELMGFNYHFLNRMNSTQSVGHMSNC